MLICVFVSNKTKKTSVVQKYIFNIKSSNSVSKQQTSEYCKKIQRCRGKTAFIPLPRQLKKCIVHNI